MAQIAAAYEVHPTQLKNWRTLALEGLPGLFEKQDSTTELKAAYEQQRERVVCRNRQVDHPGELAEKKVTTLTREERIALLERTESELALRTQTELLSLNRSSLYYQPRPPSGEEVQLKHRIDEVYTQSP